MSFFVDLLTSLLSVTRSHANRERAAEAQAALVAASAVGEWKREEHSGSFATS